MSMRFNTILKAVPALLISSALILSGCGKKKTEENQNAARVATTDSVTVMTYKAEEQKLMLVKTYTGSLEGEKQANIVSQLAERIIDIPVSVGAFVKAGQVVVKLDKGGVTSQFYQAQSNMQNAERNLERTKALFESGAVARQALDGVQTAYDIAKANFNAARNAVEITSPISGVVTSVARNIGDFTSPGAPIMTVATVSELKLIMNIGEADMPYVTPGKNVKIYSELNPSVAASGKITEIARSADLSTRTFQIKATFANLKNAWFKPGMFAKAELELTTPQPVVTIPREAVIYTDKGPKIYVIADGKAASRNVRLGLQNDKVIEVTEGLKSGEVVATVGMNNLKEGSPVIVSNDTKLLSNN